MVGKWVGLHPEYVAAVQLCDGLLPVAVAGLVQGSPSELGAEESPLVNVDIDQAVSTPVAHSVAPSEEVCPLKTH
jgi:hypothetical protein